MMFAFDFPMFQQSWYNAERLLRAARRWVFIGYSLPAADFEFKHLLKRVEVSRSTPPVIVLITGGDGAQMTGIKYRLFLDGLTSEAVEFITAG